MVYSTAWTGLWHFVSFTLFFFKPPLTLYRFGSTGIYSLSLLFMIEKMLNQYGYATTLRAYGVALVRISAVKLGKA
jgi:hypothetical protein